MAGESQQQKRSTRTGRRLRVAGEAALWLLVLGVPLALGGVHPPVFAAALVVAALVLAMVGFNRRSETVSIPLVSAVLGAATLWSLLSVVPLPAALVGLLSPRARDLASLPPEAPGAWMPLSLDVPATWIDLLRLGAIFAVVLAAAHLSQREAVERRISMAIVVSGLAIVLVGAVHALADLPALYGVFHRHGGVLPTPFVNPNHAASLATLACCVAIGLARGAPDPLGRLGWATAACVSAVGALLTLSVAGVGALVLGGGLVVLLAALQRRPDQPPARASVAAVAVVGIVVFSVALSLGAGSVFEELEDLDQHAVGKTAAWSGTLHLIRDHLWTGVGRGAFGAAFSAYSPTRSTVTFTHPENVLLHWPAEWGVPAALVGLVALAVTLAVALRTRARLNPAQSALQEGVWAGCVAVLAHDLFDFGLEFAGVGIPFAIALGLLAGQATRARGLRVTKVPGWSLMAVAAALLVLAGAGLFLGAKRQVDLELEQLAQTDASRSVDELDRAYRAVRARHPADALVAVRAGAALLDRAERSTAPAERKQALVKALPHLARAQELSTRSEPHLLAAHALARLGRKAQAMSELRQAFVVGTDSWGVAREALRIGASAEDLLSLPSAYARALSEAGQPVDEAQKEAASLLRYVGAELHQRRLAFEMAGALLAADADPLLASSAEMLSTGCVVVHLDADAAKRGEPAASSPDTLPAHGERLLELSRRLAQPSGDPAGAVWCAHLGHRWKGDAAQALQVLEEGVQRLPADSGLRVALAEQRLVAGKPEAVLELLAHVAEDEGDRRLPDVHRLRIEALLRQGRSARAQAEAEDCTRMHPTASWPHELLAGVLERDSQLVAALNALSSASRFASEGQRPRLDAWRARLEREVAARAAVRPGLQDAGAQAGSAP